MCEVLDLLYDARLPKLEVKLWQTRQKRHGLKYVISGLEKGDYLRRLVIPGHNPPEDSEP